MKKVFITGITGFVGLHLAEYLLTQNCRVFGLYYPAGNESLITGKFPNVKLYYCNLLNIDSLRMILSEVEPDIIFHLAGISSVKYSFQNVGQTIDVNIRGFCNLVDSAKLMPIQPKIIFISSADVYAKADENEKIDENTPVNPVSPYSIAKYSSELFFKYYINTNQANGVIIRPFNHIGPYQREEFALPAFAKQIAIIEKYNTKKTLYTGNLSPERDFTDVRDIVRGYYTLACANNIDPENNIFNIASGKSYKIKFLLERLIAHSNVKDIAIETDPRLNRPVDIKKLSGDYTKLNKTTGWQPQFNIDDTLKNILDYWRSII